MATRFRVGRDWPSASTICLSHRKFNQETAAPRAKPAPQVQPRQTVAAMRPPAAMANVALAMRARARLKSKSSVIAGVPHELADELDEAGDDAEEQARDVDPMRVE